MARYYDLDSLRVSDINVGTVMFPRMERCILLKDIESAPTADVVPKSEVAREILSDIKKQVHNKMVHAVSKDEYSYINIKVFDAILQNYLNNLK